MTDVYDRVREVVLRLSPTWEQRMGIAHWEIEHLFLESLFLEEPITNEFNITATTEPRWNYARAKIKWYLPSAVRHPDATLEDVLVHELCHVVLSPEQSLHEVKLASVFETDAVDPGDHDRYQAMFYERQELATEMMARALLRAWRGSA